MKKVFAAVMAGAMALTGTACSSAKAASTTVAAHNGTVANGGDSYMYCETTTCGEWEYSEAEDGEIYGNEDFNTEEYNTIKENGFVSVAQSPLSTFAADVDTGSYCNLRRMINDGWGLENVASSIRT